MAEFTVATITKMAEYTAINHLSLCVCGGVCVYGCKGGGGCRCDASETSQCMITALN